MLIFHDIVVMSWQNVTTPLALPPVAQPLTQLQKSLVLVLHDNDLEEVTRDCPPSLLHSILAVFDVELLKVL